MRLPRSVTLLSSGALPALLDLPVEPDKPRQPAEMESMISWELETQVADNNDQYNLGAILSGRGLIDAIQRQQIAVELERRRSNGNSLARFGEVALDLGLIDQNRLQESLQLQEKLVVTDSHLACGWQLQTVQREDGSEHHWLVAGIDTRQRRHWFNAFAASGLKLSAILPLSGSAATWAVQHSDQGNLVLLEAGQDTIVCYRLEQSRFAGWQSQPRQSNRSLADQCAGVLLELMRSGTERLLVVDCLRGSSPGAAIPIPDPAGLDAFTHLELEPPPADTLSALQARLQREVSWLVDDEPLQRQSVPDQILAAMLGGALARQRHHLLGTTEHAVSLPRIAPREAPPPLWKNADVYRYGLPLALVLGLLAHGVWSLWQRQHLQQTLATLDAEFSQKLTLNRQLSSLSGEFKKKEEELAALRRQESEVGTQLAQLDERVMWRARLVPRLVKTISLSVTNGVMLDRIVEPQRDSRDRFNVSAWAMDNADAAEFVERVQQLVGRLNYRVADPDIRTGIGRYGLNGYTINLWLIPAVGNTEGATP
jgi:hypothetical protein